MESADLLPDAEPITDLLRRSRDGDDEAFRAVVSSLYHDLRRLARSLLRAHSAPGHLDTTGLVHEAYLRLSHRLQIDWQDRGHFMAVAARAMRFVIIDFARHQTAVKRGGLGTHVSLDDAHDVSLQEARRLIDVDLALDRLAVHDDRLIQVVECRFFAGLSVEETAHALGVSTRTVERDWKRARAWLLHELDTI